MTSIQSRLRFLLAFGLAGTGAELVLLGHTDGFWQLVPLGLIGLALLAMASSPPVFRAVMWLFLASGAVGLFQHYSGNVEFELEMYPSLSGTALFWKAITGATPTLAPGTMILFGLLGLIITPRSTV